MKPRSKAAVETGRTSPAAVHARGLAHGLNLTAHIDLGGEITMLGPRVPGRRRQRSDIYSGRELSIHVSQRGRRRTLVSYSERAGEGRRRNPVLGGALAGIKWLLMVRPKILIIERYIWSECWSNFLLMSMGFTFFMIITSIFTLGEKIFTKNIPPYTIGKVLLLSAPAFLVLAIPIAVIFATIMAMFRLNGGNEIIAFQTSGISLYRIMVPFISLGICGGLLSWTVYEHIVPANNKEYRDVLKVFWTAQVVDFIKPGIVIKAPQRKYFYVDSINQTEGIMYDLRLYDYYAGENPAPRRFPRVFLAEQAHVSDAYLVLNDVTFYDIDEQTGESLVGAKMPEVKIDIGTRIEEYSLDPHPTELTASELRTRIHRLRDRISALTFPSPGLRNNYLKNWTEYYFKYTIPIACVVFIFVSVPLSLRPPRDERNLGLIMTFGVVMVYYMFFFMSRTLGGRGLIIGQDIKLAGMTLLQKDANLFPPYVAGWTTPVIFAIAAVFLLVRARK